MLLKNFFYFLEGKNEFGPRFERRSRPLVIAGSALTLSSPMLSPGVEGNPEYRANVLAGLQRLRGQTYYEDGAIDYSDLEPDGRYVQEVDERAWHLVSMNRRDQVCGCARYIAHSSRVRFADTTMSQSPLSRVAEWGSRFQKAVQSEIDLAGRIGVDYVEVGGWALTAQLRCTSDALRIALAMFSLSRLLGGCIGLTTATRRHCSASILRRIGGQPLVWQGNAIPGYFDARYDCEMEVLRFDSSRPNPRFELWIEDLRRHLSAVPVISTNLAPFRGRATAKLFLGNDSRVTCEFSERVTAEPGGQSGRGRPPYANGAIFAPGMRGHFAITRTESVLACYTRQNRRAGRTLRRPTIPEISENASKRVLGAKKGKSRKSSPTAR